MKATEKPDDQQLARAQTQWQFGDWESLKALQPLLETEQMQDHPDRAALALYGAAGHFQVGDLSLAKACLKDAMAHGLDKNAVKKILLSGIYNSLGRTCAIAEENSKAKKYYEQAVSIGLKKGDQKLIAKARIKAETEKLDIPDNISQKSLKQLYEEHDGYVSDKWSLYLEVYNELFRKYRDKPVSILEIGVRNGGSLEIWSKFFPKYQNIIGCDIDPQCSRIKYKRKNIHIVIGDAVDANTGDIIANITDAFDIVIDDGSHVSEDIIKAFIQYFPKIKDGGLFVAEDLHCSYWSMFQGGLGYEKSSMEFFKSLCDILNYEHWVEDSTRSEFLRKFDLIEKDIEFMLSGIEAIKFYNSTCIIWKNKPSKNLLQKRFVKGEVEPVANEKMVDGAYSMPPQH